jgi:hypothetical protein
MADREPPQWSTGRPPKSGIYIGFSDHPERSDKAGVYRWDGATFQHVSGWFDHAITHWMETDFPNEPTQP